MLVLDLGCDSHNRKEQYVRCDDVQSRGKNGGERTMLQNVNVILCLYFSVGVDGVFE